MARPRLRIFAGPNGSGKSTLFEAFSKRYETGYFINADLIENELSTKGFIDLSDYGLDLTQNDWEAYRVTERGSSLIEKSIAANHTIDISIKENVIVDKEKETHSYEGALISAFLRYHLQEKERDFCFETVMSHPSKIEEVTEARQHGYKTYLYFICIDDPEVNISRVENRVVKGGHDVAHEKITARYYNTLKNLIAMIREVDKCYLFDNSGQQFRLIAKANEDKMSLEVDPEDLPNWFVEYVLGYFA
jgi:predicted ABC-type ATPase